MSPVMIETNAIADIRATITENRLISSDISIITLECPEIAAAAKPGNFVNIKVSESTQPLLRRPFSIHNVRGSAIDIMVKSIGSGTAIFSNSVAGTSMMVLGPLGNSFNTSGQNFDTAILLSGGVGTAPMLFLERALALDQKTVINLVGGRTKEDLIAPGLTNLMFATDDGSAGFRGNVVELLESVLPTLETKGGLKVFACGPNPMLKALAGCCRQHHIPCELSLESVMGCGIGICYGCSVEINTPDGSTRTLLLCKEGPVIDAELFVL
ncbi:Oxidoreductase FAD/NAD(P)-binding:Oxidoreductase FAD-binding region [Chlorobium ferrooxidans DSM 13031]|uniref:Oxidoreductase FAD/NAD(P)-binding:Oxidoreductase FAD-binding region n=2 Tax=Chlorobium TaxID=1091 RepID=Q0YQQ3_9CHLB|nr:Oxidoreductase FAD/NAD(P)-binding:Oxidoreductase FAD-binding region [Chlorobium ferrooxidans DSM 13031]